MFYVLPALGEIVAWKPSPITTLIRFTAGSVALLHYSAEPSMAVTWLQEPVHIGVNVALPELPVLAAQFGEEGVSVAAPACIFELGDADLVNAWLRRTAASGLTLVLLGPGPAPGQAQVCAMRTVGGVLLRALRRHLRTQYWQNEWEDAGAVQAAGRQLLLDNEPDTFILNVELLIRSTV